MTGCKPIAGYENTNWFSDAELWSYIANAVRHIMIIKMSKLQATPERGQHSLNFYRVADVGDSSEY